MWVRHDYTNGGFLNFLSTNVFLLSYEHGVVGTAFLALLTLLVMAQR
jgi:hypothetical protein